MSRLGSRPNVVIVSVFQRGKVSVGVGCRDRSREMSCD